MEIESIKQSSIHSETNTYSSWIGTWEVRTKIVTCLAMSFAIVGLQHPLSVAFIAVFLFLTAVSIDLPLKLLMVRLALLLSLALFMSIPILVGGGLPPTAERAELALLLVLKATSTILLMFILFLSQSVQKLFNGLAHMKISPAIVSILFLSWRYVFLFFEKLSLTHRALKARLFQNRFESRVYKTYGEILGGIFVKSLDGSERVYRAMASRGFSGYIPTARPQPIKALDLLKGVIMLASIVLLHVIEKWGLWF